MFGDESHDLFLCDVQDPGLISYELCLLGRYIMLHPSHLYRLLTHMPDFRSILFGKLEVDPRCQAIVDRYHSNRRKRPDLEEREAISKELMRLESHRSNHQWLHFISHIWLRCGLNLDSLDGGDPTRARDLHISQTASISAYLTSGYSAVSCIIESPNTAKEYMEAWVVDWVDNGGGFPTLVLGLVSLLLVYWAPLRFLRTRLHILIRATLPI